MAHTYTWDKLAKNATRLKPKTRGANYPYVPKFELLGVVPFKGTNSCLVKLQAWGVTQNSLHQVTLLFNDCEILTGEHEELSLWDYFKLEYKGETYYVKKFHALRNPLTARCTCKDFYFTWSYWDLKAGCLYGPIPKPYKRKTTWMPERNPLHIPGCCKHIYRAWDYLKRQGFTLN